MKIIKDKDKKIISIKENKNSKGWKWWKIKMRKNEDGKE